MPQTATWAVVPSLRPEGGGLGEEGAADEYVTSEFCECCTASMWENPRDVRNHD